MKIIILDAQKVITEKSKRRNAEAAINTVQDTDFIYWNGDEAAILVQNGKRIDPTNGCNPNDPYDQVIIDRHFANKLIIWFAFSSTN